MSSRSSFFAYAVSVMWVGRWNSVRVCARAKRETPGGYGEDLDPECHVDDGSVLIWDL
jgi:hypothetical protein